MIVLHWKFVIYSTFAALKGNNLLSTTRSHEYQQFIAPLSFRIWSLAAEALDPFSPGHIHGIYDGFSRRT
jgi:hypothetical protein